MYNEGNRVFFIVSSSPAFFGYYKDIQISERVSKLVYCIFFFYFILFVYEICLHILFLVLQSEISIKSNFRR